MKDHDERLCKGKDMKRGFAGKAGVLIFGGNEDWSGLCKWMLQEFIDENRIKKALR